jgi:hypothetical protein
MDGHAREKWTGRLPKGSNPPSNLDIESLQS